MAMDQKQRDARRHEKAARMQEEDLRLKFGQAPSRRWPS